MDLNEVHEIFRQLEITSGIYICEEEEEASELEKGFEQGRHRAS